MEIHRFNNFDPRESRCSIKFLLAGPDESYDRATLILFDCIRYIHTDIHEQLATILNMPNPKLLTAGVFTRKNRDTPYTALIGSDSLDDENIPYEKTIPDNVRTRINELINGIVGHSAPAKTENCSLSTI